MQPGDRRSIDEIFPGEVTGVVRADSEVGSGFGNYFGRLQHELANLAVIAGIERGHPLAHRYGVHSDVRMVVLTEVLLRRLGDSAVAKGGAFGAAGNDSDVLHNSPVSAGEGNKGRKISEHPCYGLFTSASKMTRSDLLRVLCKGNSLESVFVPCAFSGILQNFGQNSTIFMNEFQNCPVFLPVICFRTKRTEDLRSSSGRP